MTAMLTTPTVEEREGFIERYAKRSGKSVEEVKRYRVAIPAYYDRPCDYGKECEGWHMYPIDFWTQGDVDDGFIRAEVLEWQERAAAEAANAAAAAEQRET